MYIHPYICLYTYVFMYACILSVLSLRQWCVATHARTQVLFGIKNAICLSLAETIVIYYFGWNMSIVICWWTCNSLIARVSTIVSVDLGRLPRCCCLYQWRHFIKLRKYIAGVCNIHLYIHPCLHVSQSASDMYFLLIKLYKFCDQTHNISTALNAKYRACL